VRVEGAGTTVTGVRLGLDGAIVDGLVAGAVCGVVERSTGLLGVEGAIDGVGGVAGVERTDGAGETGVRSAGLGEAGVRVGAVAGRSTVALERGAAAGVVENRAGMDRSFGVAGAREDDVGGLARFAVAARMAGGGATNSARAPDAFAGASGEAAARSCGTFAGCKVWR